MTTPDLEFDPDDNFANSLDTEAEAGDLDTPEALIWELLLLINPGDEETALQQFTAYADALTEADAEAAVPVWVLKDVIDWKSGFYVNAKDAAAFIDSVTQLAARWNLHIDWGVEDPTDADFLDGTDVPALMALAYDQLREHGYTLWTWDTSAGPLSSGGASNGTSDDGTYAGWITLSRDDEAMQELATALGIELRAGSDAF